MCITISKSQLSLHLSLFHRIVADYFFLHSISKILKYFFLVSFSLMKESIRWYFWVKKEKAIVALSGWGGPSVNTGRPLIELG